VVYEKTLLAMVVARTLQRTFGIQSCLVSCIVYRVSCIVYRVSCIVYRVSCIVYRGHDDDGSLTEVS